MNRSLKFFLILYSGMVLSFPGHALAQAPADAIKAATELSSAFEAVAGIITPSVVNISAVKRAKNPHGMKSMPDPFFEPFRDFFGDDFFDRFNQNQNPDGFAQQGLGTGVIVDDKGHILTNNHVVGGADEVRVRLHGHDKDIPAEIVGTDPRTDLAVIRIKASNLAPAKLGDSDKLKIGEWVVAAGNPFGLENTITQGIVSAKGRSIMGGGQFEDFIQTDAAINPGNSGGPLVNLNGEVVGINTAIFSKSGGYMGIGFAIPINMARNVMQSLITSGKVVRGWLGVGIQDLTDELARSFNYPSTEGALIGHVEADGPAAKAGLKQGDIILEVNDQRIKNVNQLRNIIAGLTPDQKANVEYLRDGRKDSVKVKIGELPAQGVERTEEEPSTVDLGMSLENLTSDIARRLGSKLSSGVVVRSVRPGSMAAEAGIQPRDIITSVSGKKVTSVADFNSMVKEADLKKGVRLVVQTDGMDRFVFLKADGEE